MSNAQILCDAIEWVKRTYEGEVTLTRKDGSTFQMKKEMWINTFGGKPFWLNKEDYARWENVRGSVE